MEANRIRNFCIIAHIDHGKTTFSDNLLAGSGMLSEEIRTTIDELEAKIVSGEIVVDSALGKTTEEIEAIKASVQ